MPIQPASWRLASLAPLGRRLPLFAALAGAMTLKMTLAAVRLEDMSEICDEVAPKLLGKQKTDNHEIVIVGNKRPDELSPLLSSLQSAVAHPPPNWPSKNFLTQEVDTVQPERAWIAAEPLLGVPANNIARCTVNDNVVVAGREVRIE